MLQCEGKKIAMLVCDGFEESELADPRAALQNAGAIVDIVSPQAHQVQAWHSNTWSHYYPVDVTLEAADPNDYDALILPGGVINPDKLRTIKSAIDFVTFFFKQPKIIAAICHGPWTLIETGLINHRRMTSYHSIKSDLINAGVDWLDKAVVIDGGLITSRNPQDIPPFIDALKTALSQTSKDNL